ncbi:ribonuclease H-like protein [Xylariaceae sp. FL0662B]|nr:ribonuclease H-like protein [Xylariaceae sp. FL0662B]
MSNGGELVWIDCEMTGLDPDHDEILEIFCIITTKTLEIVDENGWGTVIHQPREKLDKMDEWCTQTHRDTGLTAAVEASTVTPEQAADELLEYIKKYAPRRALLAGNSVHADRAFLRKEPYKKVTDYLHHRILDVSTLGEAVARWCPRSVIKNAPTKRLVHQAKEDILESIEEARYYKEVIFDKIDYDDDSEDTRKEEEKRRQAAKQAKQHSTQAKEEAEAGWNIQIL